MPVASPPLKRGANFFVHHPLLFPHAHAIQGMPHLLQPILEQRDKGYFGGNRGIEGIYGCLERIETAVIELQKFQPSEGNSAVPNVDNTALVQEIKALVENATGANCKYTERKIQELTKTLSENLGVVNDNVKSVSGKNKPDFVAIQNELENLKKLTTSLIPMIEESKVLHRENDYNFNLNFNSKLDWFMLTLNTIVIAFLASAYYYESQRNKDEEDDALKYRYIKMKGDASAEQIATLEDIFELNRNTEAIEQMREDVETYEEAVRKQASLAEQARLKEQAAKEQENKAKSIKDKQEQPKDNPNKKSKS